MALWVSKKLLNGWSYGYGEYRKTLAQLATVNDVYKTTLNSLPTVMQNMVALAQKMSEAYLAERLKQLSAYTTLPTYYVWAISPSGEKQIGGEWNIFTGGAVAMKNYFDSQFEPQLQKLETTGTYADNLIDLAVIASTAAPKYYKPTTVADLAAIKQDVSGGSYILPLAIAAGVLLLIFLR